MILKQHFLVVKDTTMVKYRDKLMWVEDIWTIFWRI